jgi:DNA-binding PadR family transcriptional regulator
VPIWAQMTYTYDKFVTFLGGWNTRNERLDEIGNEFLQLVSHEPYSAYEIKKYLANRKTPMDYKNIHRRVKVMKKFGLITVIEPAGKQSIHRAIYYGPSELGVYYLVRSSTCPLAMYNTIMELFKNLLTNHGNNILFKTVLYPYFKVSTLLNIYDSRYLYAVWRYLQSCCEEIEKAIEMKRNLEPWGQQIFIWQDVPPGHVMKLRDLEDKRLIDYLEQEFDLKWLSSSEVTKFENDDILKILYKNKSITIELLEDRRKAILKIDRKPMKGLNVNLLPTDTGLVVFDINIPDDSREDYTSEFLESKIKYLASELVFSLFYVPISESDIRVIAQDDRFTKVVEQTRKVFERGIAEFLPDPKSSGKKK